jgi:hypothetical protein
VLNIAWISVTFSILLFKLTIVYAIWSALFKGELITLSFWSINFLIGSKSLSKNFLQIWFLFSYTSSICLTEKASVKVAKCRYS